MQNTDPDSFKNASQQRLSTQMVSQQVRTWEVLDDDVLEVMQTIPRAMFLPEKLSAFAYADSSFQLSANFILPPPSVQGKILQALSLSSDASVLQLDAGCGYLTACLAELSGFVYYVDNNAEKLAQIDAYCDALKLSNLSGVQHSLDNIFSEISNEYDAIVMQHAIEEIPQTLKSALKIGGVAVLFTGQSPVMTCLRIERLSANEWLEEELFEFAVAPFVTKKKRPLNFIF